MSNEQHYAAQTAAALAIPADQVQEPRIPAGIYLQEAENLYQIAHEDRERLAGAGMPEQVIAMIPHYASAARQAQSLWMKEQQMRKEAEAEWMEQSPGAYDFRDYLIHAFTYAFRKDSALTGRVQDIREGSGHADMIQDLNDLAVLGNAEQALLVAINFDLEKLKQAQTMSDQLATLLARCNGDRTTGNETKTMRDRMYTLLKTAVDEVRECGKFVFWKDAQRRKLYASAYERKLRSKQRKGTPVPEIEFPAGE